MKGKCGLKEDAIKEVSQRLSVFLGDVHQLYVKTLGYHWNVEGPQFGQLHKLFEDQYTVLAENLDEVAERIRKLGVFAPGSVDELREFARLKGVARSLESNQMISSLAEDYESLLVWLREDIRVSDEQGDPGTADMLTGILRHYEKQVWLLRSHLI